MEQEKDKHLHVVGGEDKKPETPADEWPRLMEMINPVLWRLRVPGGWIVQSANLMQQEGDIVGAAENVIINQALVFYPDPEHKWDPLEDPKAAQERGKPGSEGFLVTE